MEDLRLESRRSGSKGWSPDVVLPFNHYAKNEQVKNKSALKIVSKGYVCSLNLCRFVLSLNETHCMTKKACKLAITYAL